MEYRFDQALGRFVLVNDVTIKSFGKIFIFSLSLADTHILATSSIMVWTLRGLLC